MKLIQYNSSGFVTYEITAVSLKITTRSFFKKHTREILFEDIYIDNTEKVNKGHSDDFNLTCIFLPLFLYFLWRSILMGFAQNWGLPCIMGFISLFFFLRYVFPKTEIHIDTNDKIIRLFEKKPSKKTVNEFLNYLKEKIKPAAKNPPK